MHPQFIITNLNPSNHAKLSTCICCWWDVVFTVNLLQRHGNHLLVREIDLLRHVVQQVRQKHPFYIDAWVVLPEHLHCVLTFARRRQRF